MAVVKIKTKLGDLRYQVRVRDSIGRLYPTKVFSRKVDAVRYERGLLDQKDQGAFAHTRQQKEMTVSDYWLRWSAECRGRVSEGWRMSQDQMARDYILPKVGNQRLIEIRSQDIGSLLGELRARNLSAQTIQHIYNILHKMFGDAVEHYEWLNRNPVLRKYRPRVSRKERNFLSASDSWRLLETSRNHWAGPTIWVSILSGLRPGEVQALRWTSVDFERSQILIRSTFNRKLRRLQDNPKQGDWGLAPMPPVLRDYLAAWKAMREAGHGSPIVDGEFVCKGQTSRMLCYESFRRVLRRLCRTAGVKELTPHELRHSCTELYVEKGASAEDVRRLLNQKSLSATQRYIHRTDGRLSGIAAQIDCPDPKPDPNPTDQPGRPALRIVS